LSLDLRLVNWPGLIGASDWLDTGLFKHAYKRPQPTLGEATDFSDNGTKVEPGVFSHWLDREKQAVKRVELITRQVLEQASGVVLRGHPMLRN
jgi:hypothetical protein